MISVYERAKDLDYFANYFKQMLDRYGGLEITKRLHADSQPQEGLFKLWELNALDISVEATVLKDNFQSLFTKMELEEASNRLIQLNYHDFNPVS